MSSLRWLKEGMERAREERQSWPAWMRHAGIAGTVARKMTSPKPVSATSKVLRSKSTGRKSKTAAGSALSQREKPRRSRRTKGSS